MKAILAIVALSMIGQMSFASGEKPSAQAAVGYYSCSGVKQGQRIALEVEIYEEDGVTVLDWEAGEAGNTVPYSKITLKKNDDGFYTLFLNRINFSCTRNY